MLIIFLAIPWVFKYSKMQKYSQDESVPWKRERKKENIVVCAHLPIWLFCHSSAHISIYLATLSSFLPSHVHLFPTSFFLLPQMSVWESSSFFSNRESNSFFLPFLGGTTTTTRDKTNTTKRKKEKGLFIFVAIRRLLRLRLRAPVIRVPLL